MRTRTLLLTLVLAPLFTIACSSLRVERAPRTEATPPTSVTSDGRYGFLLGLVGNSNPKDYDSRCAPGQWQTLEYHQSFIDVALTVLTYGLVTRQTVQIECGARGR